jgi:hypothetical protein
MLIEVLPIFLTPDVSTRSQTTFTDYTNAYSGDNLSDIYAMKCKDTKSDTIHEVFASRNRLVLKALERFTLFRVFTLLVSLTVLIICGDLRLLHHKKDLSCSRLSSPGAYVQ